MTEVLQMEWEWVMMSKAQFKVGQPLFPDKVLRGVRCGVDSASTIGSRLNWTWAWFIWSGTLIPTRLEHFFNI